MVVDGQHVHTLSGGVFWLTSVQIELGFEPGQFYGHVGLRFAETLQNSDTDRKRTRIRGDMFAFVAIVLL